MKRGVFRNGVKPVHVIFLILFLLIRYSTSLDPSSSSPTDPNIVSPLNEGERVKKIQAEGVEGHGKEEVHGYEIFHVEFERVEIPFIISLWIFVSSLAKIGFHMTPKLHHIFPESCLLIVVGIVIGFLLFLTSENPPSTLTPDTFFLFMLPPIILDAGYFMPNRLFFDHLGTILLMAVVGTIFNVLTIGTALWACGLTGVFGDDPPGILEYLLFSSLISAVDPVAVLAVFEEIHVDEILYIVVFGESLLNDAVTVVLYHMFEAYVEMGEENIRYNHILSGLASFLVVALGGTIVGIIWGYVTAFVTRFTVHAQILEPIFVFTMAYLSYLNAEIFHMSGILAITFCGITMKNYVERNISSKSQTTLKYAMKMLSGSSETIIFMFLGVATIHDDHEWNWAFVILTITFCTLFRALGVILLCGLANNYRLHKLKVVDQFVMMYGGLRGAVAFALVLLIDKKNVPHAPMFVTTTIAIVYWTVFVQGITIKPLVRFLNVKTSTEKDPTMNERISGRFMDHVVAGMEGVLGELGNLRIRDMYKHFDAKYIKPCLLRENHFRDPKIIETFENLTSRDVTEFMKRNPTQFVGLSSMTTTDQIAMPNNVSTTVIPMAENLDMDVMNYTQTKRDTTDTKIKHLLSENLFMPRARPRRMSYSRHAVDDKDIASNHDVNYKMHMQVRRMISENRMTRRRKNAVNSDSKNLALERSRVLGTSKQLVDDHIHQVIKEMRDDSDGETNDDGGISFSATTPAGISNMGFVHDDVSSTSDYDDDDNYRRGSIHAAALESSLPWKRDTNSDVCLPAVKQKEFPSWINNKDYIRSEVPSKAFVGDKHTEQPQSVVEFYNRRDSNTSLPGSDPSVHSHHRRSSKGDVKGDRRGSKASNNGSRCESTLGTKLKLSAEVDDDPSCHSETSINMEDEVHKL